MVGDHHWVWQSWNLIECRESNWSKATLSELALTNIAGDLLFLRVQSQQTRAAILTKQAEKSNLTIENCVMACDAFSDLSATWGKEGRIKGAYRRRSIVPLQPSDHYNPLCSS